MNKMTNYNKINLFLISIEALDIYSFLNTQTNNHYNKFIQNIKHQDLNKETDRFCNIYKLSYTKYLQYVTFQILTDYCNNINSYIMLKYINRFEYIYTKKQYGNTFQNNTNKSNIQKIAINNLYIINDMKNQYGFYILFKYILKILR